MDEARSLHEWVRGYYADRLEQHGTTARGVDWNSEESQRIRFDLLVRSLGESDLRSVLDFGCGYGALLDHLRAIEPGIGYQGFDLVAAMIDAARLSHPDDRTLFRADRTDVEPAEYVIASGIFNVRGPATPEIWHGYVEHTLDEMWNLSVSGMSFNMLSTVADEDRMRGDLHYADPAHMLAWCIARYSRHAVLLHDSSLYEFTLAVRRKPWLNS